MRWLVIGSVALVSVAGACTLTTSFDGISGTRPADTGTSGDGGPAVPPGRPPGDPRPTSGRTLWLGVKHFHFAHSNDALKKPGAWEDWGWDIDGLCTGALPTDQAGSCQRSPMVTPDQVRDGKNCRDNNFGSQIVAQLNIYNNQFENDTNNGLLAGTATWAFVLEDLGDSADDPYVPAKLYLVAPLAEKQKPNWDGGDVRTILPRSVKGGDLAQPVVSFPRGYLRNHVWVSGDPVAIDTALPIGEKGELMPLPIQAGIVGFTLNAAHTTVIDGTGQVAGALALSNVEAFLKPFLLTQTTFCPGTSSYNNLMKTVSSYADVVVGAAKLQDPSKSCDGVSLGIGINLAPIVAPTMLGAEVTAATGTCGSAGDAGAETGGDAEPSDAPAD